MVNFAFAILVAQFVWWLKNKFSKKKNTTNVAWYNVILSLLVALFSGDRAIVGVSALIVTLIVALIGLKKEIIQEKNISNWAFGITIGLIGLVSLFGINSLYGMWVYIFIGAFWIWFTIYNKSNEVLRLTPKNFSAIILLIIGLIVLGVGNYYDKETAHIMTDDDSVVLGKKEATVSGMATPNAKIKTYLDGEEITPSEKSDDDGYFSFQANTPGKWTVKVTKNGKTASSNIIVKKSKAWTKYQAKQGAKEAKEDFANAYADAFDRLDSVGVDEYNTWAEADNTGEGGTIDDTLKQVQKNNVKDILLISMNLSTLKDSVKKLQESGNSDAEVYRSYYSDIKKLQTTVLNPPAGEIDNFGNDFESQRNTVNSNLDMLDD